MRVLITGGAGYIGTELTHALSGDPSVGEVIMYDNLSRGNFNLFIGPPKLSDKVRFVHGDLLDTRKLKQLLETVDVVYHLAAKVTTPFADEHSHLIEQVNNWGTAELVYAVEESQVKRFIYMSSASVYGSSGEEVHKGMSPHPTTFYGISKQRGEEHVNRLLQKGMKAYILRCANVFGYSKSMRFDSVINKFMFESVFNKRINIFGNGEQVRPFVSIERVAHVLQPLLSADLRPGYYDLVDQCFSINQIAQTIHNLVPGLEMIYINQHLNMRELNVRTDEEINKLAKVPVRSLETVLKAFRRQFAF